MSGVWVVHKRAQLKCLLLVVVVECVPYGSVLVEVLHRGERNHCRSEDTPLHLLQLLVLMVPGEEVFLFVPLGVV